MYCEGGHLLENVLEGFRTKNDLRLVNSSLRSASYKMLFKCLSNIHGRPKSTSEFLTCSAVKGMIQEFTFLSKVAHSDDFLVSCFKKTAISILSSFLVIMCIYLII